MDHNFRIKIVLSQAFTVGGAIPSDEGIRTLFAVLNKHDADIKNIVDIMRDTMIGEGKGAQPDIFDRSADPTGYRTVFVYQGSKMFLMDTPENNEMAAELSALEGVGIIENVFIGQKHEAHGLGL